TRARCRSVAGAKAMTSLDPNMAAPCGRYGPVARRPCGRPGRRSGGRVGTELGELGADPGGLGVVEVVQDSERLLPGNAGLVRMPGRVVGFADVAEYLGLAPAIPDLA